MRIVTSAFRDQLAAPVITYTETVTVLDSEGNPDGDPLEVLSGSATEDATTEVRHDLDLVVADPDGSLIPTDIASRILPFTRSIQLTAGFELPDGTSEQVVLQTAWLTKSTAKAGDGTVSISAMDRGARLQRPSSVPVTIPAGRNGATALRDLLSVADATVGFDLSVTEWTLPLLAVEVGTDLYGKAIELATAIGCEVFVNRDDRVQLRPVPSPEPPAVASFIEGDGATVLTAEQSWTSDDIPNGIIVVGTHSSTTPIRAEAWDNDQTSPTYRLGAYGERALIIETEKVGTYAQALAMAKAELERRLGGANTIELSVIPDPSLEAGDVVEVTLPSIGATGLWVVDSLTWSVGAPAEGMSMTLRSGVLS